MCILTSYRYMIQTHSDTAGPRTFCCQVTGPQHKAVRRKGNRTNSNPATAGLSIMKTELQAAACQRMAQALDESGKSTCICMYLYVSALNPYECAILCMYHPGYDSSRPFPGPRWHNLKRRRTEPASRQDDSESSISSDCEDILPAARH